MNSFKGEIVMKREKDLVLTVSKEISSIGGRVYYVGGYVRDLLLGKDSKDIDIEIHNITPTQLKTILSKYGEVDEVGASFGILMIKGYDIDFSMPRTEKKVGQGHKGFDVNIDPFMGVVKACKRRDFTINSLIQDVLTGEVIDNFNGIYDLNNKLIRHVDDTSFIEDPLRVFRACQFASRFDFDVDKNTMKLCSQIDISSLPRERVLKELEKAILKSSKPSKFFSLLKEMKQLKPFFSELDKLSQKDFDLAMYKIDTLEVKSMETVMSILGYFVSDVDNLLSSLTNETALIKNVKANVDILNNIHSNLTVTDIRQIAYDSLKNKEVIKVLIKNTNNVDFYKKFEKLFDIAIEEVKTPLITSKDLFELGYKPGKEFGDKLRHCMTLQIQGYTKEQILNELNLLLV